MMKWYVMVTNSPELKLVAVLPEVQDWMHDLDVHILEYDREAGTVSYDGGPLGVSKLFQLFNIPYRVEATVLMDTKTESGSTVREHFAYWISQQ